MRFASIGSTIRVYYLHQETIEKPIYFEFQKVRWSLFQAPGCTKPYQNGVTLPSFICNPKLNAELD